MTASTSRLSYQDCFDVLDQALEDTKGARVKFEGYSSASYFRSRLHNARQIDRKDNRDIHSEDMTHPMFGRSVYDKLIVRIVPETEFHWVYIEHSSIDRLEVESLSQAEGE